MGRKNRNARSRSYTSYADLRSSSLRFDLSNGNFMKKIKNMGGRDGIESDVTVAVGDNGRGEKYHYVTFSVKGDVAETMKKGYGGHWTCGIVKQDLYERLYLIPDELGYAFYKNKQGTRHYMRIRIDETTGYEKYAGVHDMRYDEYNKAYYIVVGE